MNRNVRSKGKLTEKERRIVRRIIEERQKATDKHPLPFTLLASFGLVATFYGFERVIDKINFLANNPYVLLLVGIGLLTITGTLYSKLK